jgi:hypothetical protein
MDTKAWFPQRGHSPWGMSFFIGEPRRLFLLTPIPLGYFPLVWCPERIATSYEIATSYAGSKEQVCRIFPRPLLSAPHRKRERRGAWLLSDCDNGLPTFLMKRFVRRINTHRTCVYLMSTFDQWMPRAHSNVVHIIHTYICMYITVRTCILHKRNCGAAHLLIWRYAKGTRCENTGGCENFRYMRMVVYMEVWLYVHTYLLYIWDCDQFNSFAVSEATEITKLISLVCE